MVVKSGRNVFGVEVRHIGIGKRGDRFRRGLTLQRIVGWQQRMAQRAIDLIAGGMQDARAKLRRLLLYHFECILRQCGMQFIVGQQLHAAREVLLQDFQIETGARRFRGRDIIQFLLKGQPVQRLCSVGEEATQHVGHAILPGRGLHLLLGF